MNKMPKKVINDYIFYKIVCLDNSVELCYVGSTADFNKRKSAHKQNTNNENSSRYNTKIYKIIRANGGWSNFKMVQMGTREQLTIREAEKIEEEYRTELNANMNGKRCYITEEQKQERIKEYQLNYREENKDKLKIQQHKWYEENKDKLLEYQQKYNEENKDKIKERVKNYREENKDKIKEREKNYRDENREILNMKQNEKINCECGCNVNKSFLGRHKTSPKHIKLMNLIEI